MKSIAIKLPEVAINELQGIADAQYIPMRTMLRAWVLQRLNREGSPPQETCTLPPWRFKGCRVGLATIEFKKAVLVDVFSENGGFAGSNDELGILVAAPSLDALAAGLDEQFGMLWSEYVMADESTLTDGAKAFRDMLMGLVE